MILLQMCLDYLFKATNTHCNTTPTTHLQSEGLNNAIAHYLFIPYDIPESLIYQNY